jgi:hypothetical protein
VSLAVTLILAVVVLLGPTLAVIALVRWGRRLAKQGAPRTLVRAAYVVATIAVLVAVSGYVTAFVVAGHSRGETAGEPSQKARVLAEAISEVMNASAFALFIAGVGGAGIALWARRSSR